MNELSEYDEICKGMYISFTNKLRANPGSIMGVESFVVSEALSYYESIEEYEVCGIIMDFKNAFPHKIITVSRAEFFEADKWETL